MLTSFLIFPLIFTLKLKILSLTYKTLHDLTLPTYPTVTGITHCHSQAPHTGLCPNLSNFSPPLGLHIYSFHYSERSFPYSLCSQNCSSFKSQIKCQNFRDVFPVASPLPIYNLMNPDPFLPYTYYHRNNLIWAWVGKVTICLMSVFPPDYKLHKVSDCIILFFF